MTRRKRPARRKIARRQPPQAARRRPPPVTDPVALVELADQLELDAVDQWEYAYCAAAEYSPDDPAIADYQHYVDWLLYRDLAEMVEARQVGR